MMPDKTYPAEGKSIKRRNSEESPMSKRKGMRECPNCGSKNLQVEGHSSKGRQILHCEECDEVFEIRLGGDKHDRERERERER